MLFSEKEVIIGHTVLSKSFSRGSVFPDRTDKLLPSLSTSLSQSTLYTTPMADSWTPITASPSNSVRSGTRGLRSSTLPSSPAPVPKHRSHKHNLSHHISRRREEHVPAAQSGAGSLATPIGELLSPVKNAAAGLSGLGSSSKEKEKDEKERPSSRVPSGESAKEIAAREIVLRKQLQKERDRRKEEERYDSFSYEDRQGVCILIYILVL